MAPVHEHFMECNSTSAACFAVLGMVPCMVLGVLALLPVMVTIPYLFRQNERPGLASSNRTRLQKPQRPIMRR